MQIDMPTESSSWGPTRHHLKAPARVTPDQQGDQQEQPQPRESEEGQQRNHRDGPF